MGNKNLRESVEVSHSALQLSISPSPETNWRIGVFN